ncbi:MAG: Fe2+ or Zn2+ uptake regulation protein [Candidatus Saccharimonadales bacterium]|jgi:Fe2+ or Zn2+ uptake regulation protein
MQIDKTIEFTFRQQLGKHQLRLTHVRKEIFQKLYKTSKPLSIQDIAKGIHTAHFVSVYRSVDSMQKAGILKQVPQGFKNLFELSDLFRPHHHHATCKVCGTTKEVHDGRIESLMNTLTKEAGLEPTEHHFEMYGVCKSCQIAH